MSTVRNVFLSTRRRPPTSTLFPYTTLFRSRASRDPARRVRRHLRPIGMRQDDVAVPLAASRWAGDGDRKSTRLNSSHQIISYAVFCLKKKKKKRITTYL